MTLFVTQAAVAAVVGIPVAAGDEPPRFTVTTRKADDAVEVRSDGDTTTFNIKSRSGIGRAVIERKDDGWTKTVVVRLHLKGLENLTVSNGMVAVGTAVAVRDGKSDARQWTRGEDEPPLAADDPLRLVIRVLDKEDKPAARIPLDGGRFEVTLPAALLKGNPKSITLEWIDFYR